MSDHLKKAWHERTWVRVCLTMMVVLVGLGMFFRKELLVVRVYFEIKSPSFRVDQQIKDQLDGKTPVPVPSGKVVFRYDCYPHMNDVPRINNVPVIPESFFVYENRVVEYNGRPTFFVKGHENYFPEKIYYTLSESQFNALEQTLVDADFTNAASLINVDWASRISKRLIFADFAMVKGNKIWSLENSNFDEWRYFYAVYKMQKILGFYNLTYPKQEFSLAIQGL